MEYVHILSLPCIPGFFCMSLIAGWLVGFLFWPLQRQGSFADCRSTAEFVCVLALHLIFTYALKSNALLYFLFCFSFLCRKVLFRYWNNKEINMLLVVSLGYSSVYCWWESSHCYNSFAQVLLLTFCSSHHLLFLLSNALIWKCSLLFATVKRGDWSIRFILGFLLVLFADKGIASLYFWPHFYRSGTSRFVFFTWWTSFFSSLIRKFLTKVFFVSFLSFPSFRFLLGKGNCDSVLFHFVAWDGRWAILLLFCSLFERVRLLICEEQ